MVGPIIHQLHQEEQHHTIPHPWMAWYCTEDDTIGKCEYLFLGEATRWYMAVGVLWSVGRATSWPLLKWGSFGFRYRQEIAVGNPPPTSVNGRGTPPPLDPPSNLGGGKNGTEIRISNFLPFVIFFVWFWLRIKKCIWFRCLYFCHQLLFGPTLVCAMSGFVMNSHDLPMSLFGFVVVFWVAWI